VGPQPAVAAGVGPCPPPPSPPTATYTVEPTVSNHSADRATDIGAVDGETCTGNRTGACAELVRELAAMDGPLRATELIYCWPAGPADPRGFARADHCDHIHWGIDA